MTKKLLFVFAGTGESAEKIKNFLEGPVENGGEDFKDDVIRIYFNGCQDARVGGKTYVKGLLAPDLDFSASKIRQTFSSSEGLVSLNIQELQKEFGNAVIVEPETAQTEIIQDITLFGFSRGAVSTFATAKALDTLNLPISILAKDPVPGESRAKTYDKNSQYALNFDLTECKNIVEAYILLGTYSKHNLSLENKWFRQMAPKFNPRTQNHIFLVPKKKHQEFNRRAENFRTEFFYQRGLTNAYNTWDEALDRNYQIPKVEQQKFHFGVVGRTQYLPSFKNDILQQLQSIYDEKNPCPINQFDKFKYAQTLHALHSSYIDKTTFDVLSKMLLENTEKAKGAREFVVELHNIIEYSKEQSELNANQKNTINTVEKDLYPLIADYLSLDAPSQKDKAQFEQKIQLTIERTKSHLPAKTFKSLNELSYLLLAENTLTKPHLIKYIDESESFFLDMLTSEQKIQDGVVNNAQELALKLFVSSIRQRQLIFQQEKTNLSGWIKTASDLADIAPFLTTQEFAQTLKLGQIKPRQIIDEKYFMPKIADRIQSIDDFIHLLDVLPSAKHRAILFQAVQDNICKQILTPSQKVKISTYLSKQDFQEMLDKNQNEMQLWAKRARPIL